MSQSPTLFLVNYRNATHCETGGTDYSPGQLRSRCTTRGKLHQWDIQSVKQKARGTSLSADWENERWLCCLLLSTHKACTKWSYKWCQHVAWITLWTLICSVLLIYRHIQYVTGVPGCESPKSDEHVFIKQLANGWRSGAESHASNH